MSTIKSILINVTSYYHIACFHGMDVSRSPMVL